MTRVHRILLTLAEVVVLVVLLAVWALIVDERCSRNVSENDILWEETK